MSLQPLQSALSFLDPNDQVIFFRVWEKPMSFQGAPSTNEALQSYVKEIKKTMESQQFAPNQPIYISRRCWIPKNRRRVLVFCASYRWIEMFSASWQTNGQWLMLDSIKSLYLKPKVNGKKFTKLFTNFEAINIKIYI